MRRAALKTGPIEYLWHTLAIQYFHLPFIVSTGLERAEALDRLKPGSMLH